LAELELEEKVVDIEGKKLENVETQVDTQNKIIEGQKVASATPDSVSVSV